MYTKHSILVEKDSPIEITMSKVDDILMNIGESIFNQLNEKEVCIISVASLCVVFFGKDNNLRDG
jgi:hypothetical protein